MNTPDITAYPKNGLSCEDCHEPQYETPSGAVCVNGHGGAVGYPTPKARTMPVQKPGKSKQDYGTPWELIRAVEVHIGETFAVDLAARVDNAKAPLFVTPEENSLTVNWSVRFPGALAWLNPEFAKIEPWAEKCSRETGLRIVMLTPASVGANWFAEHVHDKALVTPLNPRIMFEGCEDPYPKDIMLSWFNFGMTGFEPWRWK